MNRRWLFGLVTVVAIVAFVLWWLPTRHREELKPTSNHVQPTPSVSPSTPLAQQLPPSNPPLINAAPVVNAPDVPQQQRFLALFNTPILFYGRVIDENGQPVPRATAKMRAADQPWGNGTPHERLSDATGYFEITGISGAELFVEVMKDGYHQTKASRQSFRYAGPPSTATVALPSKDAPAVFVLKQKGEPASLIHISERPIKAPKNGAPVEVSLKTGRTTAGGQGDLQVEVWSDAQRGNDGSYPWRCRLTVLGGGLLERTDPYAFEAPTEGYRSSADLEPPSERWSSRIEKHYFVALRDGCFARVEFRLRTDGEHYFVIESFLNPQPGSHNLEYEKSLKIAAPKQP